MREVLESLEELRSTTSHNRWNKDAQLLYMWNSLHGAHIINEGARHDFVPSYVICHGRGRASDKAYGLVEVPRTTFLLGKNGEREDIKKTYRYTTVKLNKV